MRLIDIEAPCKIEIELDGGKCHATVTAPTVDAVPVVRCKDCKNAREKENGYYACDWSAFLTRGDWFCSHGERKGGTNAGEIYNATSR